MKRNAVSVRNVAKLYRNVATARPTTFRELLSRTGPWQRGRVQTTRGAREHFWALQDVTFDVTEGEVFAIIGRNGAGKSTLLKILSRITEPTSGTAEIRGRVGTLLEVGTGFHPELTGRDNIYLNGAILGMKRSEIRARFDEIVAFAEVEQVVDTQVKRYSSGMYVRLAFSVAAHLEPDVMILDEVLAVGDAKFQRKCLRKIDDAASEGRTVLLVSHNLTSVQELASQAVWVDGGRVVEQGSPSSVIQSYLQHELPSNGVAHLADRDRRDGHGEAVRFVGCTVLDSDAKQTSRLRFREPFRVRLELHLTRDIRDLNLVVGVDAFDGHRITTVTSADGGHTFAGSFGSRLEVEVDFLEFALTPGSYWIHVGARAGRQDLDQVSRACALDITELAFSADFLPSRTWGDVSTPSKWTVL